MNSGRSIGRWGCVRAPDPRRTAARTPHRARPRRSQGLPRALSQLVLRQQDPRRAVLQHVRQPLARVGRIQRHVGAAGLEHGQDRHHHLDAALQAHGHPLIGPHAQASEVMRELVGPRVELGVAQRCSSNCSAVASGLRAACCFEQLVDQRLLRILALRVVEVRAAPAARSAALSSSMRSVPWRSSATMPCSIACTWPQWRSMVAASNSAVA